jgi:sulfur relay (sulfurtransferase) DsrC/TusE family protein
MANDDTDIIQGSLTDTGKWREEIRRMLAEALSREGEMASHLQDVSAAVRQIQAQNSKPPSWVRTMLNALWHGVGVTKAEVDKLFKE